MDNASMSFSKLSSMQLYACEAYMIDVEADTSRGLNAFSIVGLADKAIEEAKDRISAAIKNTGLESPKSKNHKLVISLAPAELRKEGSNFDLAMALAYLLSVGDISFDPAGRIFLGELSLDGALRPIKGALPLIMGAKNKGMKEVYIPIQNQEEGEMVEGIDVFAVSHLRQIIGHLDRKDKGNELLVALTPRSFEGHVRPIDIDFCKIKGQDSAKRALEIAAAGGHNIMLYGPPGTGKTMLARAFAFLIPELDFNSMLEVTSIHSSIKHSSGIISYPPFRSPHHSASYVSIIGGGNFPRPGEVTLAHKGVLFMDEFPEFDLRVIDSLRQPLEDKKVTIARAKSSITLPSDFILVASMNPCPCGFRGSTVKSCICTAAMMQRYQRKISGPIVDRIDMWVEVSEIDYKKLGGSDFEESTDSICARVKKARNIRERRSSEITLSDSCRALLDASAQTLHLSARVYYKIINLARTIADLDEKEEIEEAHMLEALQYRPKLPK